MSGLANWFKRLGATATAKQPETGTIYAKVYATAEAELGVKEIPGNKDTPRIREYFTATHYTPSNGGDIHDEVPWCAAFVNWVLTECGKKGTRSAAAKSFDGYGKKLKDPIQGCIACVEHIDEKGRKTGRRHVAIFARLSSDPRYEYHLGGNQGNAVTLKKVDRREVNSYRSIE